MAQRLTRMVCEYVDEVSHSEYTAEYLAEMKERKLTIHETNLNQVYERKMKMKEEENEENEEDGEDEDVSGLSDISEDEDDEDMGSAFQADLKDFKKK